MKNILFILLFAISIYSLDDITKPFIFSPSTPARSSEVNANYDTVYARVNDVVDTVNKMRAAQSIDTITSDTAKIQRGDIDTLTTDTMFSSKSEIDTLTGDTAYYTLLESQKASIDSILNADTTYSKYLKSQRHNSDTTKANSVSGLTFLSAHDSVVFIDSVGRVGIGTRTPASLMVLSKSTDGQERAQITNMSTGTSGEAALTLSSTNNGLTISSFINTHSSKPFENSFSMAGGSNFNIYNGAANNLKILSSGFMGVDTTTPDKKLVVAGSIRARDTVFSSQSHTNTINTGQGNNEVYAMNQDIETTDAVVFATINTGQGVNELYDMDQNVLTTSDVTFDSTFSATIECDSIIINDTGSFTATLTGCTTSPTGTCFYTKIGNVVTLQIPIVSGTSNTTSCSLTGLPAKLQKTTAPTDRFNIVVFDNTVAVFGQIQIEATGTMYLYSGPTGTVGTFTASGSKGTGHSLQVTYRIR